MTNKQDEQVRWGIDRVIWGVLLSVLLALSIVHFNYAMPGGLTDTTPLNWDMSGHLLMAQEYAGLIRDGDVAGLYERLRQGSIYPPLYHLTLAVWILLVGSGTVALSVFMGLTPIFAVLGLVLGFRQEHIRPAFAAIFVASLIVLGQAHFTSLSHAHMLDAPAAAMALLALGLLASCHDRPSRLREVLATLAIIGAIQTKFNFGLPLLPAAGVLALVALLKRDRRRFFVFARVATAAFLVWAIYLTWQSGGWDAFRNFSKNRSNSEEWSTLYRAFRYLQLHGDINYGNQVISALLGLLALVGLTRVRQPFHQVCLVYFFAVLISVSFHSYFLDRLFLGAGVVVAVLAAYGFQRIISLLDGRNLHLGAVAMVIGVAAAGWLAFGNRSSIDRQYAIIFPEKNAMLAELSEHIQETMKEHRNLRVLGTFNNFSEPWTRILWNRTRGPGARDGLGLEYPFFLDQSRTGWDSSHDPRYATELTRQLEDEHADLIIGIVPHEDSRWRDGDYLQWNAWKLNYIGELQNTQDVMIRSVVFPDAEVTVWHFETRAEGLRYGNGWGPREPWGRFAVERIAHLRVPLGDEPRTLVLRATAFNASAGSQEIKVMANGYQLATFTVGGHPWQWQDLEVPLPDRGTAGDPDSHLDLTLEFSELYRAAADDPRMLALAVESVSLR